ncbi:YncE family protein [Ferruginibacter paludis]|uniref:YncE family protein n=1 Tax=Ferruginibacter paludis TaxID=1310417 RepID=UPI0025B2CD77|nr:YncE family protein [Ferruginibacter paludis]MDN3658852.1 YncE family protein [Ferruginibacter paludis]
MQLARLIISTVLMVGTATIATAQPDKIHLLNTFHIKSEGGWDYLALLPNSNKLFVSHGGQVNILDKTTGDSVGVIPNTTGVHGIAFIPSLNKGYTSNGRLNNVTVFDLNTNAVLSQIATGENPDAIFYDEFSKKIITCNGRSKDLSVIDPLTEKVVATIAVGGKPETAVSNNKGKIFVNIEDKNEIIMVDITKNTVEKHWSILPGEAPTGLVYDAKANMLFAGCGDNKLLMIINAANGKVVDKIAIGAGCDGVGYDAAQQLIYTSNGEGTMTVVKQVAGGKFETVTTITTKRSARTIAVDEATHKIYLPAADLEAAPAGGGRPKMIAGTFQVLVFGQ